MPMTPGNQAIVGGTVLRIPAIQAPDYVPGVSAWIIRQDGSAEFNDGTFRGSIEVGSLTGQHFWVNNPNTGDVIDVYNSTNQLVFSIDRTGRLVSQSSVSTLNIVMVGASLFFEDTAQSPVLPPQETGSLSPTETSLNLSAGIPANAAPTIQPAFLQLITDVALTSPWIKATQRDTTGAVVQTDVNSNTNQLIHADTYTVTTDAGGTSTFPHFANFTPAKGFLAGVNGIGANFPYQYAWFATPFTGTTAKAAFKDNLGAALANTTLGVFGLFLG